MSEPDDLKRLSLDTKAVDLISIDFSKMYDVYLFQLAERSNLLRFYMAIVSAPFVIISATGIIGAAGGIQGVVANMAGLPWFIYVSFIVCGLLGVIPYQRFWAAHCEVYKIVRYMNNFRNLYNLYFAPEFKALQWKLYIEKSPVKPVPKASLHWVTVTLFIMSGINTVYILVGIYMLGGDYNTLFTWATMLPILAVVISVHYYMYKSEKDNFGADEILLNAVKD